MFKKILSSLTMMILAFSMNAGAQSFQALNPGACKLMPKYAAKNVVTSKIDLKSDEFWGGYWNGNMDEKLSLVGVKDIPVSYDAAICYPAGTAEITGMTMKGIRFSFPDCTNIQDVKVWMSTTLPQLPEKADILCQEVKDLTDIKNADDPYIEVRFDKPYEVDPSKDLYIGYTFTVAAGDTDAENYPVLIYMDGDVGNALLLKFGGEQGEWMDYNGFGFGVLAMQVLMSGTFPENAASLQGELGNFTSLAGSELTLPVVAENAGTSGIKNMDVTVTINGESEQLTIEPGAPVTGIGTEYKFDLNVTLPSGIKTGCYDVVVTIDKINGEANAVDAISKGKVYLVSKAVVKKPFVEEFTGMWCGYCPRGIIGMQKLRDMYNDNVVIAAVHVEDAINCNEYQDIFASIPSFPSANVDRAYLNIDPYFGVSNVFGIGDIVKNCADELPLAQVYAYANIDGDVLTAKSEIEFLYSGDASNFGVAYILTEDGMKNDYWAQYNYYSGAEDMLELDPLFEPWINSEEMVYGLEYDDVAIAARGVSVGLEGSVPSVVVDGDKNIHSVEFDLNSYTTIQDRTKLNLIVVLLDKTNGKVINANFVPLSVGTGIAGVDADNEMVEETARYTVDGRMISVPQKGVNIVKYNNGTVKKVVVK